ncbi:hypothetical protein CHUAL_007518 [Chamberlinius hualienensis]
MEIYSSPKKKTGSFANITIFCQFEQNNYFYLHKRLLNNADYRAVSFYFILLKYYLSSVLYTPLKRALR